MDSPNNGFQVLFNRRSGANWDEAGHYVRVYNQALAGEGPIPLDHALSAFLFAEDAPTADAVRAEGPISPMLLDGVREIVDAVLDADGHPNIRRTDIGVLVLLEATGGTDEDHVLRQAWDAGILTVARGRLPRADM